MDILDELRVFTGNAHPELASSVCQFLNIPLGKAQVIKFPNDNTFVRILENVRHRDVFIVQPTCFPVNDNLMELLIMIDALKRASAGRVTAVLPYYGYSRSDKKDQPRVPITARLVADLITVAGANRVLTIDLHAGQIQGFFNIPVDELTALPILTRYFVDIVTEDWVVVAVDIGISKRARNVAERLGIPLAIIEKRRVDNLEPAESLTVIGDVDGKVGLLFDDEIATGGSLVAAAKALELAGVQEIHACSTHAIFSGSVVKTFSNSSVKEIVVTDTVPVVPERRPERATILPVAPLLGEAIRRIHKGNSVGEMFE